MTKGILSESRVSIVVLISVAVVVGGLVVPSDRVAAQTSDVRTLRIGMQQDIPDFNTWNLASNSVWKSNVINWGFEGLVGLDYDGLPMPVLAQGWTFDEPNLEWTFTLRQGVTFHDGAPFTADDVLFVYTHARSGTTYTSDIVNAFDANDDGLCSEAEMTAAITKVDNYTVKMKMGSPYGLFLTSTAGIPMMPRAIWESHLSGGLLDVLWNDPDATISTGPWKYKDGVDNTYRIMEKYDGYWGKNQTTPLGYRMYPPNVDLLYFKMYTSVEAAILGLQSGEVDHLPWAITSARVPSLQADPNIQMFYEADNGYFYMAFNQKFDPMGSLPFRQAVSHVVDKAQIVNVYMGGFGTQGDSVLPPFWGSDGWYNASVEDYPFDPDFSTPNAILNAAGFADANGDGWRDLPDGTVMQTLTILTPPADYDPVRIRAGEMIAKNMRDGLNINAEAKALDFDTLVTRLQSMDYQMLIIGWSLSSEPVGNVFDIIGPYASSNTFGFWSEANPNPYYADLFGVVTRADAETQALADEVLRLEDLAKASFNISNQISYTRWAQGVIARAAPVDVLYYRVNVEAATFRWVGWLSYMGQIFGPGMNLFSLGNLVYSGEWTGYREVTQGLNAGLSMPSEVSMVTSAQGYVMAIDDLGRPVEGASVTLSVTGYMGGPTVTPTPWGGMTDSSGVFSFSVAGVEEGYSEITATVTLGILSCSDSAFVECVLPVPNTLSLTISSDKHILRPGELANVVAEVTDEWGASVEDATVFVDENLLSYGSVNWTSGSALTDASGRAYLQYQAPTIISPYLNTHLELMLSFTATKNGFEWPAAGSANLMVLNEDPSDWTMTQVDASVTGAVSLARAANATSIVVMVTDDDGNPLWNYRLEIRYSAVDLLFNPVDWVFTDVTGHATIDVQFKDSPTSSALRVTIGNWTVLNAVPATVTLTYAGDGPVPTMYGGYMIWDVDYDPATQEPQFVAPVGSITAVAYVWDGTGAPADGVDSALIVSGTPYGTLAWCDLINWDSTWDGWGINIITQQDGANLVTSGPFNTPYDYDDWDYWYNTAGYIYWDWGTMTGVQILGGELAIEIYGFDVAPIDLMSQVYLVPGGMCYFSDITYCYQLEGSTVISSDYVLGRTYDVLATEILIDDPVLEARSSAYDETGVGVWVTDENNLPVEGVDARVYENVLTGNRNYKVYPWAGANQWSSGYIVTDVNGYANATITAVAKYSVIAEASLRADVYAKAFSWGGYSLLTQTQLAIHVRPCFVTIDPMPDVYLLGDLVRINATVMDSSGVPLENMTVSLVAGTATILDSEEVTDASGRVAFWVFTSSITNDTAGFMLVIATADGVAYRFSQARATVALRNASIDIDPPVADAGDDQNVVAGLDITFDGSGSSDNVGIVNWTWTFTYDSVDYELYGEFVNFTFLSEPGSAVVTLTVYDAQGSSDTDTMTVNVSGWIPEYTTLLLPVVGIAGMLLLFRRRRRKAVSE